MFFQSKAKKALMGSGENMLRDYRSTIIAEGVAAPDQDAALMFSGFTHFAITVYLQTGQIKPGDIVEILNACAMNVRKVAPAHDMGTSYLEDTADLVKSSLAAVASDPQWQVKWAAQYLQSLKAKYQIKVSDGTFLGMLARDGLQVVATAS